MFSKASWLIGLETVRTKLSIRKDLNFWRRLAIESLVLCVCVVCWMLFRVYFCLFCAFYWYIFFLPASADAFILGRANEIAIIENENEKEKICNRDLVVLVLVSLFLTHLHLLCNHETAQVFHGASPWYVSVSFFIGAANTPLHNLTWHSTCSNTSVHRNNLNRSLVHLLYVARCNPFPPNSFEEKQMRIISLLYLYTRQRFDVSSFFSLFSPVFSSLPLVRDHSVSTLKYPRETKLRIHCWTRSLS